MKKIIIITLILIGILSLSFFIVKSQAVEYYEWVQNGSFEPYINYFEDSGAESNAFNSGVQYGNFSASGALTTIELTSPHNGIRHFQTTTSGTYLWYNLTDKKIGADIINASFYHKYNTGDYDARVTIYYDDDSADTYSEDSLASAWTYHDFIDTINDAKYVIAFQFYNEQAGNSGYWDDFVLYDVDDDSQEWVNYNTLPWYEPRIWAVDLWQEISDAQSHIGNQSYHDFIAVGNEGYGYQGGVPLTQCFKGLDSNTVNDFRLYAMTDNEIDITVMFLYSDETYSSDTKYVNASDWTLYVFDVAVSDKTVVGFSITPYSKGTYTVNMWLDDISLTATQNYDITPVTDSDHDGIPDEYDTIDDEEWIDDDEDDEEERANNMIDWIIMFIVIFLPAILLGGALYENNQQPDSMHINPVYGVLAGLILSVGVGVYTTVLPVWLLILIIIAVVIIIVGMVRH